MSRHLKTRIISRLKGIVSSYVPPTEVSASHRRGVRYLEFIPAIKMYCGKMNTFKEGSHYNKHIIVRRVPRCGGNLYQLYTYHFPTHWSTACVANRELIKLAQRQAHALEHDYSPAALEWRLRFFTHYFRVVRGGAEPEPGMKRYSRFYQYTYVAIYRELQSARDAQQRQTTTNDLQQLQTANDLQQLQTTADDISFEPISRPLRDRRSYPLTALIHDPEPEIAAPPIPIF